MSRTLFALAVLSALAGLGCDTNFLDPTRYGSFRDTAPVVVLSSPGPGPLGGRYGDVVVGFDTWLPDGTTFLPASRVGVSGGESSPFYHFAAFNDGLVSPARTMTTGPRPTLPTRVIEGCEDLDYCGDGSSRSITAVGSWSFEGREVHGCTAIPAGVVIQRPLPPNEMLQIRCETAPSTIGFVDVPDDIEFGASSAPIPASLPDPCRTPVAHPAGAAVFGAPSDDAGRGAIHVLLGIPDAFVVPIDLSAITIPDGAGLGHALATTLEDDGTVLVAASTRSATGDDRQVILFTLTPSGPGTAPTATVHACVTNDGPGFGHSLAFGDLDDDGTPELVVGGVEVLRIPEGGGDAPISIWSTATLRATGAIVGCGGGAPAAPPPDLELDCPSGVTGLTCGASGFGTSLAVGDIDGDEVDDLVVGAPLTASSTGAVVVFRGSTAGLDRLGTEVGRVVTTTMRTGALMGFAVATVTGTERDEIVASLPGVGEVDVILCTELRGDRSIDLPRDSYRVCSVRVPGVAAPMCGGGDAGMPRDAGVPDDAPSSVDGGDVDAGEADAGEADAGDVDAGDLTDAGDVDAG